jgi:recombination protein RecA
MKKRKKALLIALVLGDGYIRLDSRWKTPRGVLQLCHAKGQLDYLKYKVDLLHSLIGGAKPNIREYTCSWPDGTKYQQVKTEKGHKYFRVLRKWMYPNKYNINCLKHLTPEAIAIWYMDDGSIIANNKYKDGTCSSARTNIHTCTNKENADLVCKYFKDFWDIKFTPFLEKGTYSIRCFHKEGKKFHEMIHKFIIPSMKYKQRFYYDTSA